MFRKLFPLLVIGVWGVVVLPMPNRASAETPLTQAVIQNLRNMVQLMPKNSPKRPARPSDTMIPGDGLSTGRASLAELRFNDRSLARVGEQAVFRFLPKTRNFNLSNGTVLLLIPPGQGKTRVHTPNAAAAIRGSALFVRYDEEQDTTIVGALTDSGIQVFNQDASQNQTLKAGQLMVIVKGQFQGLYDFDLRTFYETSDLVRGLDLTRQTGTNISDPAIARVQAETAAAVAAQLPIKGQGVVENPSFVQQTAIAPNLYKADLNKDNSPTDSLLETGEIQSATVKEPVINERDRNTGINNNKNVDVTNNSTTPQTTSTSPNATTPTLNEIQTQTPPQQQPTTPTLSDKPTTDQNPSVSPTVITPTSPTPPTTPTAPTHPTPPTSPTPPTTPTAPTHPTPPTSSTTTTSTTVETSPNPPVTVTPTPSTPNTQTSEKPCK